MANYMTLFHEKKNSGFSNVDKSQIRHGIISTFNKLNQDECDATNQYITSRAEAERNEAILEANGYDVDYLTDEDMTKLPAYLNVGDVHPAEIIKQAQEDQDIALANIQESKNELFENVYQIVKTSDVVDPKTIKYLGPDYEEFAESHFNKDLETIKNDHSVHKMIENNSVANRIYINQLDSSCGNIGEKLLSTASITEIKSIIGDSIGVPDDFDMNLTIEPDGTNGFAVIYDDLSIKPDDVTEAVYDEMESHGLSIDDFYSDDPEPLTETELNEILTEVDTKQYDRDSKIADYEAMQSELKHAEEVMNAGFDEDGYNMDGFDNTGHSADGEYNSMYDEAYTSPDF